MADASFASDAERMDRHYRLQRYVYDITREYYLLGRKHLIAELRPEGAECVLEIGCGTAWNLARAARRYPQAHLCGVDISAAMLETARASLSRKGLVHRVTLQQGDAASFDPVSAFGAPAFGRVFISYALSMIPCWREALDHAAGMVAPGGALHIVDFGQCERLPSAFKRALLAFLGHYSVTPRPDLEACCREIAERHGLALRFERLNRGYTHYAVLTRQGKHQSPSTC